MTDSRPNAGALVELKDLDLSGAKNKKLESKADGDGNNSIQFATSTRARPAFYRILKPAIANQAEEAADRIHGHMKGARGSKVEIGKELLSIKDKLDHGQFGMWLDSEFTMTARSAQIYMNVARMVAQTDIALDLPDTVLQLLAAPKADSVRDKIIDDIKAGKVPTPKSIKQMIAGARGGAKAPAQTAASTTTTTKRSMPAKSASTAATKAPAASIRPASEEGAPRAIQTPSSTTGVVTTATTATTATPSLTTTTVTPEEAATRLMKWLATKLPTFAKLYHIAGYEVFEKAMAKALKEAADQPAPEKIAA